MHGKDAVTEFYKAQGKHSRQLGRLTKKIQAKWRDRDFKAIEATRRERDTAVAALSHEQKLKHVDGLTPEQIKVRLEARRKHLAELEEKYGEFAVAGLAQ